jgi:hypothetical protein
VLLIPYSLSVGAMVAGASTEVEAFTGAEGDFAAALPVAGTMVTAAVAFAGELHRARVIRIRTGDQAGSRLVRPAIPPSATGSVPVQMA